MKDRALRGQVAELKDRLEALEQRVRELDAKLAYSLAPLQNAYGELKVLRVIVLRMLAGPTGQSDDLRYLSPDERKALKDALEGSPGPASSTGAPAEAAPKPAES